MRFNGGQHDISGGLTSKERHLCPYLTLHTFNPKVPGKPMKKLDSTTHAKVDGSMNKSAQRPSSNSNINATIQF